MNTDEFNEIRPYRDDELPAIFEELIADPDFRKVVSAAIPDAPFEVLAQKMRACKTKLEFQQTFCYGFLNRIIRERTDGLTVGYDALPDKGTGYTYISNHRDIVLDSGFLSLLLLNLGLDTVEIAIGNNLLIYPWIKKLVRVNKSFIVERGLSPRQQLESSARMSRYIHCTVAQRGQSIWIAQREGRAKDSNDHTQESVLKMLALGGEGEPAQRLAELNIVPLSLSYEYDPCDYLKAREFQLKRDVEGYKKTTQDDLENMATGIFGYKGRVHFHLGKPVNGELHALPKPCNKQAFFAHAAACIDRQIYANYRLYPGNYVAYDWLNRTRRFADRYTPEEKQTFERYIEGQLAKIELPCRDDGFLRERLLEMYANPLVNHLSTQP